jgi:hypothetical protein
MRQASMKYKLGKLTRVPLDTLSFANYHQYMRDEVFMKKSKVKYKDDYSKKTRQGWSENYISNDNFAFSINDKEGSLISLIHYLFHTTINRDAKKEELDFFISHIMSMNNGSLEFRYNFNMMRVHNTNPTKQLELREKFKRNITVLVLDYISRLSETYIFGKAR